MQPPSLLSTLVWSNAPMSSMGHKKHHLGFDSNSPAASVLGDHSVVWRSYNTLRGNSVVFVVVVVVVLSWSYLSELPKTHCYLDISSKISAPTISTTRGHSLLTIQNYVGSCKRAINIMLSCDDVVSAMIYDDSSVGVASSRQYVGWYGDITSCPYFRSPSLLTKSKNEPVVNVIIDT